MQTQWVYRVGTVSNPSGLNSSGMARECHLSTVVDFEVVKASSLNSFQLAAFSMSPDYSQQETSLSTKDGGTRVHNNQIIIDWFLVESRL